MTASKLNVTPGLYCSRLVLSLMALKRAISFCLLPVVCIIELRLWNFPSGTSALHKNEKNVTDANNFSGIIAEFSS